MREVLERIGETFLKMPGLRNALLDPTAPLVIDEADRLN